MALERVSNAPVVAAFQKFSAAWRGKDWASLEDCLSERVVFVVPRFHARLEGLAACLDSFRSFTAKCEIVGYEENEVIVDRAGPSALVTYRWKMRWRDGGAERQENGREVLVFADEDGVWRITWRVMLEDIMALN